MEVVMKKWMFLVPMMVLGFLAGQAFADMDMATASKDMGKAMKCEVVDVGCYMKDGMKATGEKHQACAAKCISGGGELALMYKGKLYIPVDSNYHSVRDQFVSQGGTVVSVTGKTISKGGLNYLVLADQPKAAQ